MDAYFIASPVQFIPWVLGLKGCNSCEKFLFVLPKTTHETCYIPAVAECNVVIKRMQSELHSSSISPHIADIVDASIYFVAIFIASVVLLLLSSHFQQLQDRRGNSAKIRIFATESVKSMLTKPTRLRYF